MSTGPDSQRADGVEPYIVCDNLVKIYQTEDLEVVALQGLDLQVRRGEMMAIIGNSGSGMSTLLSVLGGLDRPSAGQCRVGDLDILQASEADLARYKRHGVGFVWQQSSRNLIPYLTAFENVRLPMLFGNMRKASARAQALLKAVDLEDRMHHRLSQLSGGQQQRVAIAISLANDPDLLLADEPTGEVDTQTAGQIYDILRYLNRERRLTIIIVSHDRNIAQQVDRVVAIRDGRTSTETVRRVSVHDGDDQTHDEFVIVDDTGRLQIPQDMLDRLDIRGRATVDLSEDSIVIRAESSNISTRKPVSFDQSQKPQNDVGSQAERLMGNERDVQGQKNDAVDPDPSPNVDDGRSGVRSAEPSRVVPTEQRVIPIPEADPNVETKSVRPPASEGPRGRSVQRRVVPPEHKPFVPRTPEETKGD